MLQAAAPQLKVLTVGNAAISIAWDPAWQVSVRGPMRRQTRAPSGQPARHAGHDHGRGAPTADADVEGYMRHVMEAYCEGISAAEWRKSSYRKRSRTVTSTAIAYAPPIAGLSRNTSTSARESPPTVSSRGIHDSGTTRRARRRARRQCRARGAAGPEEHLKAREQASFHRPSCGSFEILEQSSTVLTLLARALVARDSCQRTSPDRDGCMAIRQRGNVFALAVFTKELPAREIPPPPVAAGAHVAPTPARAD
jgi:hypothetical protein